MRKFVTMALIGAGLVAAGCNTVRGAGKDVQSVADCTEDLMKQGRC